jgi:hypothetical protein
MSEFDTLKESLDGIHEKLDQLLEAKPSKKEDDDTPAEVRKVRGRPSKESKAAVTMDEAKAKLKEVLDTKGRKKALSILEDFEAEKVGDIDEENLGKFVKACDKALEESDDDLVE